MTKRLAAKSTSYCSASPRTVQTASIESWTRKRIAASGGDPEAAFLRVDMKVNFSVESNATGQTGPKPVGGTHGYMPSHPELRASFFIAGPGIKRGLDLGSIDMRSIAPTLARCLGVPFNSGDLKALPVCP